jgi:hypothetical protein
MREPHRAIVYQHPRSPVVFDPREPPHPDEEASDASVIRALQAANRELQQSIRELARQSPESPFEVLDASEALGRIAARIGWKRLAIIVRNLAHVDGEEV